MAKAAKKHRIALSPNGHGGAVRVMQEFRDDFDRLGVTTLFYHQVDNPLIAMADPEFLGFVLDYLLQSDALVLAFAQDASLPPERVARARAALPGGYAPDWT